MGMGKARLDGIVLSYANCPFSIFAVGGHIEGLIGATSGLDGDTSEETLKHEITEVVLVISLVFELRLRKIYNSHDSRRRCVQQLIKCTENDTIGSLFLS